MVTRLHKDAAEKAGVRKRIVIDSNQQQGAVAKGKADWNAIFAVHGPLPWNTLVDFCLSGKVLFPGPATLPSPAERQSLLAFASIPPEMIARRFGVPPEVIISGAPTDDTERGYFVGGLISLFNGLAAWQAVSKPAIDARNFNASLERQGYSCLPSPKPVEEKLGKLKVVIIDGRETFNRAPTGAELRSVRERAGVSAGVMARRLDLAGVFHLDALEGYGEGGNPDRPARVGDIETKFGHGLDGVNHAYAILAQETEERERAKREHSERKAKIDAALSSVTDEERLLFAELFSGLR
jgi:hypothetical protein